MQVAPSATEISVVMPFRNARSTLAAAVRSIAGQTCHDWELILVDDGSTDDSVASIRSSLDDSRLRLISHRQCAGLPKRLNEAIAISRGRLVARMDADDVCLPERLERQRAYLRSHPEVCLVGAGVLVFDDTGRPLRVLQPPEQHQQLMRRAWSQILLPHPTWMGRIEWFREHPYQEHARRAQDQCLLFEARRDGRYACLPEVLLGYRGGLVDWRKSAAGRRNFVRSVRRHGTLGEWVLSCAYHAGAALYGAVLGRLLATRLRRHYHPVPPALSDRWIRLWSELQVPDR